MKIKKKHPKNSKGLLISFLCYFYFYSSVVFWVWVNIFDLESPASFSLSSALICTCGLITSSLICPDCLRGQGGKRMAANDAGIHFRVFGVASPSKLSWPPLFFFASNIIFKFCWKWGGWNISTSGLMFFDFFPPDQRRTKISTISTAVMFDLFSFRFCLDVLRVATTQPDDKLYFSQKRCIPGKSKKIYKK